MSTSNHAQTDRQSENAIKTLSRMLKHLLQRSSTDWDKYLPKVEFEYNCSKHDSTGITPFKVDIGILSARPITREVQNCKTNPQYFIEEVDKREAFRQLARDSIATAISKQKSMKTKIESNNHFKRRI